MRSFENPARDEAEVEDGEFDPATSDQGSDELALSMQASAVRAEADEDVPVGTALGILGADNPLRRILFKCATHTYVARQLINLIILPRRTRTNCSVVQHDGDYGADVHHGERIDAYHSGADRSV